MGLGSRQRTRAVLVLLALVAGAAAIDGSRTWRQQRWNARIVSGEVPAEGKEVPAHASDLPAELRFAQAWAQAGSDADEAALQSYRALHDASPLGQAARYNSANLLMRQALAVSAGTQPGQAIALIELAKEMYRDVLRVDPRHWDARYNLERAQRLLADPDDQPETAPADTQRDAERAATTMRGFAPGLP